MRRHRIREPRWHRQLDAATGLLLCALALFSPWAFGSLPVWSIWAMNMGGIVLGLMWLAKLGIRRVTGYRPRRTGESEAAVWRYALGAITLFVLLWCATSALNSRGEVDLDAMEVVQRSGVILWLPHSFDRAATEFFFWQLLGLAGVFWASRDWLKHASSAERRLMPVGGGASEGLARRQTLPDRLRRLMWLLCLNGAAVASVGIISSIDNPAKLMWILSLEHREGEFFGPFFYRNHGAAFINLIWPMCLALWISYGRRGSIREGAVVSSNWWPMVLLPVCLGIMIAAVFFSKSRGGSVVAVLLLAAVLPILIITLRTSGKLLAVAGLALVIGGGIGVGFTWQTLKQRFFHEFYAYPTRLESRLEQFTIRAVLRIPSLKGRDTATFAGLSDDSRILWNSPGSITLSLRRAGLFEARFVASDRTRVLTLSATDTLLAESGRTVEVIFTHDAEGSYLYLNGRGVDLQATRTAGFDWPPAFADRFLWVGRGAGGSMIFRERIEAVTLLDHALTPAQATMLADPDPQPAALIDLDTRQDRWAMLRPGPRVNVRPSTLAPSQWIAAGLGGRTELHQLSRQMMRLYPAGFGSGPGTFPGLFMVLRQSSDPAADWHAHNDHLETRITFGWVGMTAVYLGLLLCLTGPLRAGGAAVPNYWYMLVVLGWLGAMMHSGYDWLFQSHTLLFLGVVLSSILSVCYSPLRTAGR